VRVSTKWRPIDALEADLRLTATEATPTGNGILADNIGPGGMGFVTGYYRQGLSFWENNTNTPGEQRIRNQSAVLNVRWRISDTAALTSITSFDQGYWYTAEDSDGTYLQILFGNYTTKAHAWTQDLRVASTGDSRLQWLVGVYGYSDSVTNSGTLRYLYSLAALDPSGTPLCFIDGITGCAYSNQFRQDRTSYAAYTQESYRLSDALSLTAGLRYTHDQNKLPYYQANFGYIDPTTHVEYLNVAPTISAPPVDQLDGSNVSGKVGIEFNLAEHTLLYANASSGYRGGAFNGAAFFSPDEVTVAKPEHLYAYEIGAKTTTLNNKLRVDGSVFYYDYENQQFINVSQTGLQVLYNAPKSRMYGSELEFAARPVSQLDLRLGGSYLNAKYQEITLQGQDLSGNTLILAPEWTVTGSFDWHFLTSDIGSLTLRANTRYTSKMYFDAFNTDRVSQPAYWVHNARLTYEAPKVRLQVSAWVNNLANEQYRTYRLDTLGFFNYDYAQRGRPREYGLDAQYSF
jgi:iron complex outermembrane receptor protein